jgi:glycosyltransferase involved in cell wall biosynthesis
MQSPTLSDFPPAPAGKSGWPWTEETPCEARAAAASSWPRISIVTPSYNQGEFLEETIRSVLLQGYPNLEYIIIDGGSADQSVEIIRRYEKWLAYWVSETDRGQSEAINKGFSRSTGDICAYLNSDDVYLPNALHSVARLFEQHPEAALLYGDCQLIDESSRVVDLWLAPDFDLLEFVFRCYIPQQATFWRKSMQSDVGDFNEEMHFAFDYEMWLRIAARQRLQHAPLLLAQHRKAEGTKTVSTPEAFGGEIISALQTFFSSPDLPREVKAIESDTYAFASIDHALLKFRLGRFADAREDLETGFKQSPDMVTRHRERIIRAFVAHADPSNLLEAASEYLDLVFSELPERAQSLLPLKPNVLRRVQILNATRSKDRRALRRARRLLLPVLIDDFSWMRNHAARYELLSVLIGRDSIRRLASLGHFVKAVRGAFGSTRKTYA